MSGVLDQRGELLGSGSGAPGFGYKPPRSYAGIGIVIALHLVLAYALVNGLAQRIVEVVKAPLETKLIAETTPPPPPPPTNLPPPPLITPPVLQVQIPQVTPPPQPVPQQQIQVPPPPAPTPPPPPAATPEPVRAAPPAPTITAPAQAARNPDAAYNGELIAYLNTAKRYPTSREARQLRPQGTVRIWIELDRAGQLINSGVESSSGFVLIDNEALKLVRNGKFPPFPADVFVGQSNHRFVVAMEYVPPGN